MSWNHRIIFHEKNEKQETYYAIHEVFYNDDDGIWAFTTDPVKIYGDEEHEIKENLERMLEACDKPILIASEVEANFAKAPFEIPDCGEDDIPDSPTEEPTKNR